MPWSDVKVTHETGSGVPEALPRTLLSVGERLGLRSLDRLWIFPPLIRGRREHGLVTASQFHPVDQERRLIFSAPYAAERTGRGLEVQSTLEEQGEAPPDRVARIMEGVVKRSGEELGEARQVEILGDPERFRELLAEFDAALFVLGPVVGPPEDSGAEGPKRSDPPRQGGL